MEKVRWGVLGTAKIATEKVIPALQGSKLGTVTAIASRDLAKATESAARLGIPVAHASYEQLLADERVDAIYNPLPNHLHVPWSMKALAAGKHVLCEKPIGLTVSDARRLIDAAEAYPHLKIMEAFMYRHHPQWQKTQQLILDGGIGELRTMQTFFSYFNDDPQNIRNVADFGGGAVMDIGCYPISFARFLFAAEPIEVRGLVERDQRFGVDRLSSGMLKFANGTATFTCATQLSPYQRTNIFGTTGRIEIEIPVNAPADRPCRIWHEQDGAIDTHDLPTCDQYGLQGDALATAIIDDLPVPTPLADALRNMEVIERLLAD